MKIQIKNVNVWHQNKLEFFPEVAVVDGIWVGEGPTFFDKLIDAQNAILMPALTEIHSDFKEPGLEYIYSLKEGVDAMIQGGFDTTLLSPATEPVIDNPATVEWVENKLQKFPVNIWMCGCISLERKGKLLTEMVEMHREGALAFGEGLAPLSDSRFLRNALKYATQTGARVHLFPLDAELGKGIMNAGALSSRYGLSGIPMQAEEIAVWKLICLAEMTACPLHLKHLTSVRSIQMVKEAQGRGIDLTFDVTLNHLLWSDLALENLDSNFKLLPPLRSESNRKLLIELLLKGEIEVLSCQHTPVLPEFKNCPIDDAEFGALGLETAISGLWGLLDGDDSYKVAQVQKLFNQGPRKVLGLEKNEIGPNQKISAVLFQPNAKTLYNSQSFSQQVHNSPFLNQELQGEVCGLLTQGQWLEV